MLAVIRADRSQPYGQVNSYFTYILQADYLALCEIIERTSDKLLTSLFRIHAHRCDYLIFLAAMTTSGERKCKVVGHHLIMIGLIGNRQQSIEKFRLRLLR